MANEWLKLKIVRDVIKNKKLLYLSSEYNKFNSKQSQEYKNIISLSRTMINHSSNFGKITDSEITLSNLNKIDFDFLLKISKLENVIATNGPSFIDIEIIDNNAITTSRIVLDILQNDTYNFIKSHNKEIFFVYVIEHDYARWFKREDKYYSIKIQKKRKNKIKEIESKIKNEI